MEHSGLASDRDLGFGLEYQRRGEGTASLETKSFAFQRFTDSRTQLKRPPERNGRGNVAGCERT